MITCLIYSTYLPYLCDKKRERGRESEGEGERERGGERSGIVITGIAEMGEKIEKYIYGGRGRGVEGNYLIRGIIITIINFEDKKSEMQKE